jgi:hypothetical protein
MKDEKPTDQLPDEEIARRMERGLRRALSTPPQPHGKNPKSPPLYKSTERLKIDVTVYAAPPGFEFRPTGKFLFAGKRGRSRRTKLATS